MRLLGSLPLAPYDLEGGVYLNRIYGFGPYFTGNRAGPVNAVYCENHTENTDTECRGLRLLGSLPLAPYSLEGGVYLNRIYGFGPYFTGNRARPVNKFPMNVEMKLQTLFVELKYDNYLVLFHRHENDSE
jgi:hypothetical protein